MNLEPFTGPGSTPSRRRFWDKVTAAVIACQKVEGNNVTVAEHQGAGTLINVNRVRGLEGGVGACCYDDGTCDDLTEADCNDAGGNWQGTGTTCADDPNPCLGACCEGEGGTTCVEDSTPDSCADDGGTFQGFQTTCDPNPCVGACCYDDGTCDDLTEADCNDAEGNWQGPGTTCADDPNPCVGACCEGEGGTTCVEDSTPDSCASDGGTFQGFQTTCDPNPCLPENPCCGSGGGFMAFDGSCRRFLTKTTVLSGTEDRTDGPFHQVGSVNITSIYTVDPDTCEVSCERSGDESWTETDTRNSCVTQDCSTISAEICGQWIEHQVSQDSHSGTGCTLIGSANPNNPDFSDACGNDCPFPACVALTSTGYACLSSSATEAVAGGSDSDGSWTNTTTLSDEVQPCTGACCNYNDNTCRISTECDCTEDGESYIGDDTICPDDCGF